MSEQRQNQNPSTLIRLAEIIVPVVVAAIGQLAILLSYLNQLDKNVAIGNLRIEAAIKSTEDAQNKIQNLNEKISRLQYSDEKLTELKTRFDALDARIIALKTQINIVEDRLPPRAGRADR